ncbi:hypothetical protein AV530_003024 [Patagioenas fasciata monilis]|uniref:Uncharacterized protein n=1 Tax=Patagioenas fasciata monilis TaxID=372326 RepID=A0A1V4KVL2_PATFA|nr:hypothetical protein AV530_003024 [Patagioenas fasciata monilis]
MDGNGDSKKVPPPRSSRFIILIDLERSVLNEPAWKCDWHLVFHELLAKSRKKKLCRAGDVLCYTKGQSSEDAEEKRWSSSGEREGRPARRTQMAHYRWDHMAPSRLIQQSVSMPENSFRGAPNLCGVFTRC